MKNQINRKAILLSAFFTALLLTLAGGGFLLSKNWTADVAAVEVNTVNAAARTAQDAPTIEFVPAPVIEQQATQPDSANVAAYRSQLEAAYAALNEAYAQIETMQSAQQAAPVAAWDDDDEHEGHGEHEEHEHAERTWEGSEHEHDDD
jgi:hypothetical protein